MPSRIDRTCFVFVAIAACGGPSQAPSASARASTSAPAPGGSLALTTSASAASSGGIASGAPVKSLLAEGRRHSKAEEWPEAARVLGDAATLAPDDVAVLSELGWAALHAGDLDLAERVSKRALDAASDPRNRAQTLYNLGRIAEARGAKTDASHLYEQSLALRPSKTVEERLAGVGGTAPAPAPPTHEVACDKPFANTAALCACLAPTGSACGVDASSPTSESGELEVVKASTSLDGENVFFLVADDQGGVRPVAELGHDYHPGAFGIDQTTKILAIDEQRIGDHKVAVARVESADDDTSNEGAEVIAVRTLRSTVCLLRDTKHPTTCPLSVPIETDDTHSFPRPAGDLTAEARAYVEAHAKEAHEIHVRRRGQLAGTGEAVVALAKGEEKEVTPGLLGHHPLF